MSLFCKHEWETISDVIFSPSDVLKRPILNMSLDNVSGRFFDKTHVVIVKCTKCGKLKKFVTKS